MMSRDVYSPALSKTAKYKKITKPLLERKRRARINRCLDELKDLMVGALEIDDDNISKLEKADILELTVNHLTKLHRPRDPVFEATRFQAGFAGCAAEACRFILSMPGLDTKISENLVNHLSTLVSTQPLSVHVPASDDYGIPMSPHSSERNNDNDYQKYSSDSDSMVHEIEDDVSPRFRYLSEAEDFYVSEPTVQSLETTSSSEGISNNQSNEALLITTDRLKQRGTNIQSSSAANTQTPQIKQNVFLQTHENRLFNVDNTPNESKDIILKKIRQHIMDKRNNIDPKLQLNDESSVCHKTASATSAISYTPLVYDISSPNNVSDPTLDLRINRSPVKSEDLNSNQNIVAPLPSKTTIGSPEIQPRITYESYEKDKELASDLMCNNDIPKDFNNLPPKKKRKHLEYQELRYKAMKQLEEERPTQRYQQVRINEESSTHNVETLRKSNQFNANDNADHAEILVYDEDDPMWRPW